MARGERGSQSTQEGAVPWQVAPHRFGTAYLEIVLFDDGGHERGGIDRSTAQMLIVNILSVNDAPKFSIRCPEEPMVSSQHHRPSAIRVHCTPGCFWAGAEKQRLWGGEANWEVPFIKGRPLLPNLVYLLGGAELDPLPSAWNRSVYETELQLHDIEERVRRGILSEANADLQRRPLELLIASLRDRLAHYVYVSHILQMDARMMQGSRYLPSTPADDFRAQQQVWNNSIHETELKIEEVFELLAEGIISEATANAERLPLEQMLQALRERLAYYVYVGQLREIDPECRISVTMLENCVGCELGQTGTCAQVLTHEQLVSSMGQSINDATDESEQQLMFDVSVVNVSAGSRLIERTSLADSSASSLEPPSVDLATGDLNLCVPKDSYGAAAFSLMLYDDGGSQRGGTDHQGPVALSYTIYPINQAPSFHLCECNGTSTAEGWPVSPVWDKPGFMTRTTTGSCCGNATGCCATASDANLPSHLHEPLVAWCSSESPSPAPSCHTSVYVPHFTEFESRVVLSIDVELIDLESPSEYLTSITIGGHEVRRNAVPEPRGHQCGAYARVYSYEVPVDVYGRVNISIHTSASVNDRFHSQNCNGKSVNARVEMVRGSLLSVWPGWPGRSPPVALPSMYLKSYNVWKTGEAKRAHHVHEGFAWGMLLGNSGPAGVDMEAWQSYSFTVSADPDDSRFFRTMPVVHVNGTLEFEVLGNVTGHANVSVGMSDDGYDLDVAAGTLNYTLEHALEYTGVNQSTLATFSIFAADAYALVRFNTSGLRNRAPPQEVADTARRVIAAGQGLALERIVVLSVANGSYLPDSSLFSLHDGDQFLDPAACFLTDDKDVCACDKDVCACHELCVHGALLGSPTLSKCIIRCLLTRIFSDSPSDWLGLQILANSTDEAVEMGKRGGVYAEVCS